MRGDAVFGVFGYLCSVNHDLQIDNDVLVEECLKGDKDALNLFYVRFAPRMLGVIRRYVPGGKDAEDILHDGFIVAFTRLGSLRDRSRVDYWLASIMKNLSLQFLQSQDVAGLLHDIPEMEDTPEINEIIDLEVLESLVRKLPTGYQKVFRLAVLENRSHKEIARLLGIAPNTSSSQLFHAKLMMRKLVTEYWRQAGVLSLLLVGLTGIFVLRGLREEPPVVADVCRPVELSQEAPRRVGEDKDEDKDKAEETADDVPAPPPATPVYAVAESHRIIVADSLPEPVADIVPEMELAVVPVPEEIAVDSIPVADDVPLYAYADEVRLPVSDDGWSLGIGVDAGLSRGRISGNTSDLPVYVGPGDTNAPVEDDPLLKDGVYRYGDVARHNHLPISVALSVNRTLGSRFGVETGLTYTYLHSTFETEKSTAECHWHYIGVLLKLNINLLATDRIRLYTSVGGRVDIPLYSNSVVTSESALPDLRPGRFDAATVWSVGAGCGFSVRLTPQTEIFLEPTLQYHFGKGQEVPNSWTDNPWTVSLPVGFRLNW